MSDPIAALEATVYSASTYARLQAIKARYDPTNLFRGNLNIVPAAPARTLQEA